MRILWICNIPLVKTKKNRNTWCGGWMTSTVELLKTREDIELLICYPQSETRALLKEKKGMVLQYGFYVENRNEYDAELQKVFYGINNVYKPEIVHVFGTEFPHSYSAVKVWQNKAIISIQGLIGVYAKHYFTGLPAKIIYSKNDDGSSIYGDMRNLKNRGEFEYRTLLCARNIIGRTEWDYACVQLINPKARYFKCNEVLRSNFYDGEWKYSECKKHSILISQADYPVKGIHIFLRALRLIKRKFPDVEVTVTGRPLKIGQKDSDSYTNYITGLIERWNLKKTVKFIGVQNEVRMKEHFLRTNVFVQSSVIENSPNSLGEAMILGVPCVVSGVGGVSSLIKHGEEGFVYQVDAEYMLAYYVEKIFDDLCLAEKFSENARKRAHKTHDQKVNLKELTAIYRMVSGLNI